MGLVCYWAKIVSVPEFGISSLAPKSRQTWANSTCSGICGLRYSNDRLRHRDAPGLHTSGQRMTRAKLKFCGPKRTGCKILTSLESFSVLTWAARVHLGAFDSHYYSEDHKFQNKSRSPTFILTYFVITDWHVSQNRFCNHKPDHDRSWSRWWIKSQLLADCRWGNDMTTTKDSSEVDFVNQYFKVEIVCEPWVRWVCPLSNGVS